MAPQPTEQLTATETPAIRAAIRITIIRIPTVTTAIIPTLHVIPAATITPTAQAAMDRLDQAASVEDTEVPVVAVDVVVAGNNR